jgi:hypothetical protein
MTQPPNRSPRDWFLQAAVWYVNGHQGCVCCGGAHCVFRSDSGHRIEYYCSVCDFSTCHDLKRGHYYATVGDGHGLLGLVLEAEPA